MKQKIASLNALLGLALANANGTSGRYVGATGDLQLVGSDYTGQGDPSLKIMGTVQNFAQEGHVQRRFGFSITNSAEAPRTVRLFAGYFTDNTTAAPGQMKDGAFNDVNGSPGLSASSTNAGQKIAGLLQYVLYNPTRIVAMRITCPNKSQFNQELNVGSLDPFVNTTSYPINPGLGFNGSTFDATVADINTNGLQLDETSDILYTILPGTTVNFLLFAGASMQQSQALAVKASIAQNNLNGSAGYLQ
jgi:hypothetical protein